MERYNFSDPTQSNPFYTVSDTSVEPSKMVATLSQDLPFAKLYTIGLAYMLNDLYGNNLKFNPLHFADHQASPKPIKPTLQEKIRRKAKKVKVKATNG